MIHKIIKVGNELYLHLPDEITKVLKLMEGSEVTVSVDPQNKQILIQSPGHSEALGEINLEFSEQVTSFIRDYKPALDELARLE